MYAVHIQPIDVCAVEVALLLKDLLPLPMLTLVCAFGREGLKQRKLITLLFIWVACGFVGTELCLFLACRPFAQYWAVPPADRGFPTRC